MPQRFYSTLRGERGVSTDCDGGCRSDTVPFTRRTKCLVKMVNGNLVTLAAPKSPQEFVYTFTCIPDRIGICKCWFLRGRGKPKYPEKNLSEQGENQQKTHPTYDAGSGNQTPATMVAREHSHHCATPAARECYEVWINWVQHIEVRADFATPESNLIILRTGHKRYGLSTGSSRLSQNLILLRMKKRQFRPQTKNIQGERDSFSPPPPPPPPPLISNM